LGSSYFAIKLHPQKLLTEEPPALPSTVFIILSIHDCIKKIICTP
jgi:hypothetical protein